MKKHQILHILLGIIFFTSCKKEYTGLRDQQNPTSYLLKRQIWTGPVTNGESFLYIYNGDNLVSRIERYQWGNYNNTGVQQTWNDTSYYMFEYKNGLCTRQRVIDNGADGYFTYVYNDQKLPVKRTLYYTRDNVVQFYSFYKYDNLNNLVEKVDSTDKVNFRYVFTYDSNNNLTSATNYILWTTPQQKSKYEWLSFDDKINFTKAINGLPVTSVWDNSYNSYSSSSPHNSLANNSYFNTDINQSFGLADHITNSYQYNDEGLPVKMFSGPWTVIFEYEKYK